VTIAVNNSNNNNNNNNNPFYCSKKEPPHLKSSAKPSALIFGIFITINLFLPHILLFLQTPLSFQSTAETGSGKLVPMNIAKFVVE